MLRYAAIIGSFLALGLLIISFVLGDGAAGDKIYKSAQLLIAFNMFAISYIQFKKLRKA
jgi:hypothetical protein